MSKQQTDHTILKSIGITIGLIALMMIVVMIGQEVTERQFEEYKKICEEEHNGIFYVLLFQNPTCTISQNGYYEEFEMTELKGEIIIKK